MRALLLALVFTTLSLSGYAQTCASTNVTPTAPTPPARISAIPTPPAAGALPTSDPCFVDNCPAVGTVCSDGTIYAGLSPDGNKPMFTTRCNYGQTWSGTACTGTTQFPTWDSAGACSITAPAASGTTGRANTKAMATTNNGGNYQVAKICYTLSMHGHADWYVPAKNELNVLYTNNVAINAATDSNGSLTNGAPTRWTSTEQNVCIAWNQNMSTGVAGNGNKNATGPLRCVRRDSF